MRRQANKQILRIAESAMQVFYGESGLDKSWQADFPEIVKCCHCGGEARIMFVGQEYGAEGSECLCALHDNGGDGDLWFHDAVSVACYACKDCLEITAKYNQA